MQQQEWVSKMLCWVWEARHNVVNPIWLHLDEILKKTSSQWQQVDKWLPGAGAEDWLGRGTKELFQWWKYPLYWLWVCMFVKTHWLVQLTWVHFLCVNYTSVMFFFFNGGINWQNKNKNLLGIKKRIQYLHSLQS